MSRVITRRYVGVSNFLADDNNVATRAYDILDELEVIARPTARYLIKTSRVIRGMIVVNPRLDPRLILYEHPLSFYFG